MAHIKDVLQAALSEIGENKCTISERVCRLWETSAPENMKKHVRPKRVKKNILYVTADASTWAYEISQQYKQQIINKINKQYGEDILCDIRVRVGDLPAHAQA